ncbi:hypothetical protein WL11_18545 [Burkholderia ubonensis]|nr:hypothetical protein WL11_18545 [Burkholderia ubonensis]
MRVTLPHFDLPGSNHTDRPAKRRIKRRHMGHMAPCQSCCDLDCWIHVLDFFKSRLVIAKDRIRLFKLCRIG